MSKKANPTFIGAFVLVGLAVSVTAIMVLGGFNFKDDSVRCVAYFSGSLHGLDVGAPVAFRGVAIGRVSSIRLDYDEKNNAVVIPVYMDLRQDIKARTGEDFDAEGMRNSLVKLIERGLKAQMQPSSLLTGKQYVELSLKPALEPSLHGGAPKEFIEIPTISSGLDKITETLDKLPLEEILGKVAKSLDSINEVVSSGKAGGAMQRLMNSINQLEAVLSTLNRQLPQLLADVGQGAENFSSTMKEANSLIADTRRQLKPAGNDLQKILANMQTSTDTLNRTLSNLERLTASDSDLQYQLYSTMHEVEQAAGSVRELSDYLRRNPNALLFGQGKDK